MTSARRALWLVVLGAAGGAAVHGLHDAAAEGDHGGGDHHELAHERHDVRPQEEPAASACSSAAPQPSAPPQLQRHGTPADIAQAALFLASPASSFVTARILPVDGGYQSPEQIAAFARLLQELPRPMLVFCRSGARSTRPSPTRS